MCKHNANGAKANAPHALGVCVLRWCIRHRERPLDAEQMHAALEGKGNGSALDQALQQLESEPQEEQACAAKFELYERYSKLTSDARNSTHALWLSVEADFAAAPAVKNQIDCEIRGAQKTYATGRKAYLILNL